MNTPTTRPHPRLLLLLTVTLLLCFLLKFSHSASASSSSSSSEHHPTTTTAGNSRDNGAPVPSVLPPTPTTYFHHSILKLTPDTIREVIQNSNVLIYFHEPSCAHCRRFTSTFNQLANTLRCLPSPPPSPSPSLTTESSTKLKKQKLPPRKDDYQQQQQKESMIDNCDILVAQIDISTKNDSKLLTEYGIDGFPTVKLFMRQKAVRQQQGAIKSVEFKGKRTLKNLLNFLHEQLHESS